MILVVLIDVMKVVFQRFQLASFSFSLDIRMKRIFFSLTMSISSSNSFIIISRLLVKLVSLHAHRDTLALTFPSTLDRSSIIEFLEDWKCLLFFFAESWSKKINKSSQRIVQFDFSRLTVMTHKPERKSRIQLGISRTVSALISSYIPII